MPAEPKAALEPAAAFHDPSPASPALHTAALPSVTREVLEQPGRPLDAATRGFMESRFEADFSGVRVHADEGAAESAEAVARARLRWEITSSSGRPHTTRSATPAGG
jgi:hypothetical protein